MLLNEWDIDLEEKMSPLGLCNIIENRCQPEINTSISHIDHYFTQLSGNEIPDSVLELVQILYSKLQDEVQHVFRKESGLIYPGIKKMATGFFLEKKASDTIEKTQQVISNLLLRLRQLLNNYVVPQEASQEWKDCVHELYQLEIKLHRWIYIEQSMLYPAITNSHRVSHKNK